MGNAIAAGFVNVVAGIVVYTGKGLWILAKLGFTAVGIAADSAAAAAQSFYGNLHPGSIISQATSMFMRS
jgi:hypothetical protein